MPNLAVTVSGSIACYLWVAQHACWLHWCCADPHTCSHIQPGLPLSLRQQQHVRLPVAVADCCFLHMVRCWRKWIWVTWGHLQPQLPSPALCGVAVHMLTDMHMHMIQTMMLMTLQRTKVPPPPLPAPIPALNYLCFWTQPYTSRLSRLDNTIVTILCSKQLLSSLVQSHQCALIW